MFEIESTYRNYLNIVTDSVQQNNLGTFKSSPEYRSILEHVYPEVGARLLASLREEFKEVSDDSIARYIEANDRLGMPSKASIAGWNGPLASPSCFRYIYHAHLILQHMKSLNLTNVDIVEIGGGYGGLCLAISHFAASFNISIGTYSLIDLAPVAKLQGAYLAHYSPLPNISKVTTHDAERFGDDIPVNEHPLYLISCYAFGEIRRDYQESYIATLFPKVSHGFILYNCQDNNGVTPDNIGRIVSVVRERPEDIYQNKFWYF